MSFVKYNPNPWHRRLGDCTVRAISKALDMDWASTYILLVIQGFMECDMPASDNVWGHFLESRGFVRDMIPDYCTVDEFSRAHPHGTYILAPSGHVVCVQNGDYYDSWDSGDEIPLFVWYRRKNDE